MRFSAALLGVPLVCVAAFACAEADGIAGTDARDWWGRAFTATSVEDDGGRRLEPGTEIDLFFEQREDGEIVRWNAGCNTWGARVSVGAERIHTTEASQSASGCPEALDRQDEWLREFFASDPAWERDGKQLTLMSDGTQIEFNETTDEGVVPSSAFTAAWSGADGHPAERGEGRERTFEVSAHVGSRHCDWESAVFLNVVWPLGSTYEIGPDARPIYQYVRDPEAVLGEAADLSGDLVLDSQMPEDAEFTGYHTDQAELWFGPDDGDRYAYLDTDRGVERWPRAREPVGCA